MPSARGEFAQLAGHFLHQRGGLDDAGSGDQEQRAIDADPVALQLHALATAGSCAARQARAARTKPVNSGWPSRGVEVNSG